MTEGVEGPGTTRTNNGRGRGGGARRQGLEVLLWGGQLQKYKLGHLAICLRE